MQVKKQQLDPYMKQQTASKLGKEYIKAVCILSPCLFSLYAKYIMGNYQLDAAQTEIKIARRNINNLRYKDDTTLKAESGDEIMSPLLKVKEENEEASLKFNNQKTMMLVSSPITSCQQMGEKMETVTDFIFLGSKNHCGR